MPSPKYTRIEITQEAYAGLEAEAIIQRKTLKKLASELILQGISKKALNFVRDSANYSEIDKRISDEVVEKIKKDIWVTDLKTDETILDKLRNILLDEGYQGAMFYVAQNTASLQRDELFRVLALFQQRKISSTIAADLIVKLNK